MSRDKKHILLSGGGTGGHIFPAIAIANALKRMLNDPEILFVGAKGRMEMQKVPHAGYPIKGIWISGFQRKLSLKNLLFPLKVLVSLVAAGRIIKRFQPDVVIGTGGYASGPALKAAARRHIPTLIHEQNSYPGITNRLLAKQADCICVAHQGMDRYFPVKKIIFTGNPVREDVVRITGKREEAVSFFGLDENKATLLIIGGSQGALSVNQAMAAHLETFCNAGIQVIWQTGHPFFDRAGELVNDRFSEHIHVHSFIERMDLAYAAADVVVSRAGAIAISELCLVMKPAILVPLPHAAEDHQTKNALKLVENHAALMIRDEDLHRSFAETVMELIKNKEQQQQLREEIGKMGSADAAFKIAQEAVRLMKR
ncbi:MAG TPA: undecaprenyldiphospho-muramoylpentapeptide beta-N-acetylglucosaminyltransferase [Bacteroidales bacterium]|nr:undecaprenyldiphospho-muramoylpentapeptide beta-N-acetylglucosaminyltransferase [Bacteroidales bacterium]HNS46267.1 undecaprenyldiphospho-muramoylpentapeptide beta-N-acetylglucosaminyltransferase [Bacteroidales bacterium]